METKGTRYDQPEQFRLEGFGVKVICAQGDRPEGVFVVVLPGQNYHFGVRSSGQHILQKLEALGWIVGMWGQPKIHCDDGGLMAS